MPTVIVYWSPNRTPEQKAAVVQGITDTLVNEGDARREDVLIIFQDIQPGNAGRAGAILTAPPQFANPAPADPERPNSQHAIRSDGSPR